MKALYNILSVVLIIISLATISFWIKKEEELKAINTYIEDKSKIEALEKKEKELKDDLKTIEKEKEVEVERIEVWKKDIEEIKQYLN